MAPCILNLITKWRWVGSFMTQMLYPRERDQLPITEETEWAPKLVWMWQQREKNPFPTSAGLHPSHYTD